VKEKIEDNSKAISIVVDFQLNIFTSEMAQRCRRTHFQAKRLVKG